MSVAPAECDLQSGMQLRQGGLLGDPQPASHPWRYTPQPHAQLHSDDFTVVDYEQTLTLAFQIAKCSGQHPLWTALIHRAIDDCARMISTH